MCKPGVGEQVTQLSAGSNVHESLMFPWMCLDAHLACCSWGWQIYSTFLVVLFCIISKCIKLDIWCTLNSSSGNCIGINFAKRNPTYFITSYIWSTNIVKPTQDFNLNYCPVLYCLSCDMLLNLASLKPQSGQIQLSNLFIWPVMRCQGKQIKQWLSSWS